MDRILPYRLQRISWKSCQRLAGLSPIVVVAVVLACRGVAAAGIDYVRATDREIVIKLSEDIEDPRAIHAIPVDHPDIPVNEAPVVCTGVLPDREIHIPRYKDDRDRLYCRFQLVRDGEPIGSALHVTDLSGIPREAASLPIPSSPKGLQCIVDIDDAIALGVKHSAVNVSLAQLYDPTGQSSIVHVVDGVPIAMNPTTVAHLDATIGRMTAAGMRVNLILLNYLPAPGEPTTPLVDPRSQRGTPQGIGGFHLDTPESLRLYRGLIEFLAARYSRPGRPHGAVAGYIIGNEIQSHYAWYNLGDIDLETLVKNYARALRVADLAVRRHHPDARVFISMDHNWNRQHFPEPTRSVPGRVLLEALHAHIVRHGDFPWGVAFHPYPENLGDPRAWNDTTATLDFDTPRITFKNLEVLTTYLQQPRFLFQSHPRRILLSEQGFHCLDTPDGELLQAAAFAYAYERVRRIEGIEAFIYHRHVDHAGEGGLRLGLRANRPNTISSPGAARKIYHVFQSIDTPGHAQATDFALDVIGLESWDELAPRTVDR